MRFFGAGAGVGDAYRGRRAYGGTDAMQKQKKPGSSPSGQGARSKGKSAGDTESKPSRPKRDHKGQGREGAKARRKKDE